MNKELGMLLGLHTGDSLGATLEFKSSPAIWQTEILGGGVFNWRKGQATDDTDLMLVLLRSIEDRQTFSMDKCKEGLIDWLSLEPVDVGRTTRRGISLLSVGQEHSGYGEDEQGNGSLMRCAPLALLDLSDLKLEAVIKSQAKLTHGHPNCVFADQMLVRILKLAMVEESILEIYSQALNWSKPNSELHERIKKIPKIQWEDLSTSGFVFDGIVSALWALMSSSSFEEGLIKVINRGDDSDTNGAITGALLGAYYGASEIPERWRSTLERANEVEWQIKRILKT